MANLFIEKKKVYKHFAPWITEPGKVLVLSREESVVDERRYNMVKIEVEYFLIIVHGFDDTLLEEEDVVLDCTKVHAGYSVPCKFTADSLHDFVNKPGIEVVAHTAIDRMHSIIEVFNKLGEKGEN